MKDKTQTIVLWILIVLNGMVWWTFYKNNTLRDTYIGVPQVETITFKNDKKTIVIEKTDNEKGLWFLDKEGTLTHVTMDGEIYKLQKQQTTIPLTTKEKKDDTGNIGSKGL